jgi:hypothetical protein
MTKVLATAAMLTGALAIPAFAAEPTPAEEKYCDVDYRKYCNEDGIGSELLTLCMRQHGHELSPDCIKALEEAGELTPAEEAEAKKHGL